MKWKTEDMVKLAKEIAVTVSCELVVETVECGGDHDTTAVCIDKPDVDAIVFCGFHTTQCMADKDDCDVEMIEMRSWNSDSSGGVETKSEELAIVALRLKQYLRDLGWSIVRNLEDYF